MLDSRISAPSSPSAVLLAHRDFSPEERYVAAILGFFGVPWRATTAEEIGVDSAIAAGEFSVLTSAQCLADALFAEHTGAAVSHWLSSASSTYIYGFQNTEPCKQLLRTLTADSEAQVRSADIPSTAYSISRTNREVCGPMCGLTVIAETSGADALLCVRGQGEDLRPLISARGGELFLETRRGASRFYLNASCRVIDIYAPCTKYFDVRRHFTAAAPLVMYLRSAFRNAGWRSAGTTGCLIIDDPPLKPRYGFLRYEEALQLMDRHNFTMAVGFIPWNWSRTNRRTVNLFQNRPDRLSLCVHGSDHTGSEFASRSPAQLTHAINTANERMDSLTRKSALPHAQIMVFPQGAFSTEAGRALKLGGYVAAVNTEVAPEDVSTSQTTIADVWNIAILKYGSFPIFTRRYCWHGIENFAFDGLLGKPCLLVGHHDSFRDHARVLVEFVCQLNSLSWDLRWLPLDAVLHRSYRLRSEPDGANVVQMFAERLLVENPSEKTRNAVLLKQETDPDCVRDIELNGRAVPFGYDGRHLCWNVQLEPNTTTDVRVHYWKQLPAEGRTPTLRHNLKVTGRRYLSEFRDNYLSQSDLLSKTASKFRHLFH